MSQRRKMRRSMIRAMVASQVTNLEGGQLDAMADAIQSASKVASETRATVARRAAEEEWQKLQPKLQAEARSYATGHLLLLILIFFQEEKGWRHKRLTDFMHDFNTFYDTMVNQKVTNAEMLEALQEKSQVDAIAELTKLHQETIETTEEWSHRVTMDDMNDMDGGVADV
jgi:hypothetical protein